MQKQTFLYVIFSTFLFNACDISSAEQQEMEKSLQLKRKSLVSELKQLNDSLTLYKNQMKICTQQLKVAQGFHYINPQIKEAEINSNLNKINGLQDNILNAENRVLLIKMKLEKTEKEIKKL